MSDFKTKSTKDPSFRPYGQRYEQYPVDDVLELFRKEIEIPETGNIYIRSIEAFETLDQIRTISADLFGGFETQVGICAGYCDTVDGLEYHQGSEVVIIVQDCILALGKREDVEDQSYDLGKLEYFYAESGDVLELYGTTLHYMPLSDISPLGTVCILLRGTNEELPAQNGLLAAKNKYLFSRESCGKLIGSTILA